MSPVLPFAASVWVTAVAVALTIAGVALLWSRRPTIGSLVLIALFAVGLAIGGSEHFFVAGPYNVFDVRSGGWALPFKVSVALLVVLEMAGISGAVRMLARRPVDLPAGCRARR